jgi:hypothetical protein
MITAVLDTSILLRKGLMEFVLRAASADACALRLSQSIYDETIRKLDEGTRPEHLVAPLTAGLKQVAAYGLAVVEQAHTDEADGLVNDPLDVHVLASAFAVRDEVPTPSMTLLVTDNLRDFQVDAISGRGVVAVGADAFGCYLLEERPVQVFTQIQREPPERFARFLERMRSDGLTGTADAIEAIAAELEL